MARGSCWLIVSRGRSLLDTDDVVQDALLGTFRRLDHSKPKLDGALLAYPRQAVHNRIRNELRRHVYYYRPFDGRSAFASGWRLTAAVRVADGTGFASLGVDTGPSRPKFEITLGTSGSDAIVWLRGRSQPVVVSGAGGQWVELELQYDPRAARARRC